MITRAKFQNFKALRDVEVTFDSRLTVIVGPNGSGKTSVLEAIQFLSTYALTEQAPTRYHHAALPQFSGDAGLREVYGWQNPGIQFDMTTLETGTRFSLEDRDPLWEPIICRYECLRGSHGLLGVPGPAVGGQIEHRFIIVEQLAASVPPTEHRISGDLPQLQRIRSTTFLKLDPESLASPSVPTKLPPETGPTGAGLASVLGHLLRKYPDTFQEITDALRIVVPNVSRLRLDYVPIGPAFGDMLLFDFKTASEIPASATSDGTLIILGLLSVILRPNPPKLILLDDLDHRLHPKAQMNLVDLLHKLLDQYPDLQIIATSHSPYILDKLKPEEVRVMALKDDGSAACARLEDHPKYPMWKDSMSPGEFWSHAGEDWVKQLTPQPAAS